jgi:hypothetical protein
VLKHKNMQIIIYIYIYMTITPVFFGDRLLLHMVVLVETTNFWSYEDTSCAEFCSTELFCYHRNIWCFSVDSSYVYSMIMVVE